MGISQTSYGGKGITIFTKVNPDKSVLTLEKEAIVVWLLFLYCNRKQRKQSILTAEAQRR